MASRSQKAPLMDDYDGEITAVTVENTVISSEIPINILEIRSKHPGKPLKHPINSLGKPAFGTGANYGGNLRKLLCE
jgi:hypothetical protein